MWYSELIRNHHVIVAKGEIFIKQAIKETDLYEPIKKMLEQNGFLVKGEVKNCDIAAIRKEELWIVEMKLNFSIKLLYQAMTRLAITPKVFVAIPRPKKNSKDYKQAQQILKKLELGLITVALDSPLKFAEIVLFPGESNKKISKKAQSIRKEIQGRSSDTPGGSNRTYVTTAFRERCIKIACFLSQAETLSPKDLRTKDCGPDTGQILQKNHYGWFYRVSRGRYALSDKGRLFIEKNSDNPLVQEYQRIVFKNDS